MRLIDAEWVLAGVATLKECYEESYITPLVLKHIWAAVEMVERLLKEAPTIEAEPVRHGRWISVSDDDQYEGMFFCSLCKDDRWFGEEVYTSREAERLCHYCPNCGAKMDLGSN